jgi:hypothetical protein
MIVAIAVFVLLTSFLSHATGIHAELEAAIQDLLDNQHYIHFLDFGEGGSYFVSYD